MTKNSDEMAFDTFIAEAIKNTKSESQGRYILSLVDDYKEVWQAAIAHERKRREGLVELALFIMKDNEWHNDEGSIEYQVYKILEKAIEEL